MLRLVTKTATVTGFLLASSTAAAQFDPTTCNEPSGPQAVTPASNSSDVTIDAPVRIRYSPDDYFSGVSQADIAALFTLTNEITSQPVPGFVQNVGADLVFRPAQELPANGRFRGRARGFGADSALSFTFATGRARDVQPPQLEPLGRLAAAPVDPSCQAPDGGHRVDVSFAPASDDGPGGAIEYLLYQTKGAELPMPILRARARNFTTQEITMAFVLTDEEVAEPICVQLSAVDGVGRQSALSEEGCFDPITGSFYDGICSVATNDARPRPWAIATTMIIAIGLVFRRFRR